MAPFSFPRFALAAALLALPLAGCATSDGDAADAGGGAAATEQAGAATPTDGAAGDPRAFVPSDDLAYVDFLLPHHLDAVHMAQMVVEGGARDDVRALAERIAASNARQADSLRQIRQALGAADEPAPIENPTAQAAMQRMMELRGAPLDSTFLADMIPHHAGAVAVTHNAMPNLQREDLHALAMAAMAAQVAEIGEMHRMMEGR